MIKSIPLSSLAAKTKGPKVAKATPTIPTGRQFDEMRIRPATNGFTVHTATTAINPPKAGSPHSMPAYEEPKATVFSGPTAHADASAHVASVLAEHSATQ